MVAMLAISGWWMAWILKSFRQKEPAHKSYFGKGLQNKPRRNTLLQEAEIVSKSLWRRLWGGKMGHLWGHSVTSNTGVTCPRTEIPLCREGEPWNKSKWIWTTLTYEQDPVFCLTPSAQDVLTCPLSKTIHYWREWSWWLHKVVKIHGVLCFLQ